MLYEELEAEDMERTSGFHKSGVFEYGLMQSAIFQGEFQKTSPYDGEESIAIWCMKNSPSIFSNCDLTPFLDEEEEYILDDVDAP